MSELYVFIDNSFLFIQGYKHASSSVKGMDESRRPKINYKKFKSYISKNGDSIKRIVLVGSNLSGNIVTDCQKFGFEVFTSPRYPNMKKGTEEEKGVDMRVGWEIAKTIFTNKDSIANKKIILCSGDKDFMPIFGDIQTASWSLEVWIWGNSYSPQYESAISRFGKLKKLDEDWKEFIDIVQTKNRERAIE